MKKEFYLQSTKKRLNILKWDDLNTFASNMISYWSISPSNIMVLNHQLLQGLSQMRSTVLKTMNLQSIGKHWRESLEGGSPVNSNEAPLKYIRKLEGKYFKFIKSVSVFF